MKVLGGGGYDDHGLAQFLAFGAVLTGGTIRHGVRRLSRARILDIELTTHRVPHVTERKYHDVVVRPDPDPRLGDKVRVAFDTALSSIAFRAEGRVLCTLSGGMDSRTIASAVSAARLPFQFATHFTQQGNDLLLARAVARSLGVVLDELHIPSTFTLADSLAFAASTNGMSPFTAYNTMSLYPMYARRCDTMIDGNHTSIEGRWFLRNLPHRVSAQVFHAHLRAVMLRSSLLFYAADPESMRQRALNALESILPDPTMHASPGCCADVFYAEMILPHHGTDVALLQRHYTGYVSPYFDLRYIDLVSRLTESMRWRQIPQRRIIAFNAPRLVSMPRSYCDVRTLPTSNPYVLRLPVLYERMLQAAARRPALGFLRSLSIARPSGTYRIRADRDLASVRIPPYLDEHKVRAALQPDAAGMLSPEGTAVLHLVLG